MKDLDEILNLIWGYKPRKKRLRDKKGRFMKEKK